MECRTEGMSMLTSIRYSTVVNNSLARDRLSLSSLKSSNGTEWYTPSNLKVNEELQRSQFLGAYIAQISWVVVLWVVKCSISAFYWRLFKFNGRLTRVMIRTITVGVLCWGIAVVRSSLLISWLFFSSRRWSGDRGLPTKL